MAAPTRSCLWNKFYISNNYVINAYITLKEISITAKKCFLVSFTTTMKLRIMSVFGNGKVLKITKTCCTSMVDETVGSSVWGCNTCKMHFNLYCLHNILLLLLNTILLVSHTMTVFTKNNGSFHRNICYTGR